MISKSSLKKYFYTAILISVSLSIINCTKGGDESTNSASRNRGGSRFTIQKNEGINVNEADAIWVAGMMEYNNSNNTRTIKVHKMKLSAELNYPVQTWDLVVDGANAAAGFGSRTYVTEEGMLLGKSGGGEHELYLIGDGGVKRIWRGTYSQGGSRATPFAYRVFSNGQFYNYYGISFLASGTSDKRIIRFRKDTDGEWKEVRGYRYNYNGDPRGIYSGFLDTCSRKINRNCAPIFYGGSENRFAGVDLTQDVPGAFITNQFTTVQPIIAPNDGFRSTSHPNGGNHGSLNNDVYSIAGDEEGNLIKARYPDSNWVNDFVSYDKVNQLIYHTERRTRLESSGELGPTDKSAITIFKKVCVSSEPNCDPTALAPNPVNARIFRDVGGRLGPTSDLGNGCVAIIGWKRPGEENDEQFFSKIYKACVRDGKDLDKGLSLTLLGEVEGSAYMYNDFTGATLYDRPIYILYDFEKRGFNGIKDVKYFWSPKIGFGTAAQGIISYVRCFPKGQQPAGDTGFVPFTIGVGIQQHAIANCAGSNINQVEFKFERDQNSSVRFTRFENLSVSAIRN